MKIKLSDYVALFLHEHNINQVFMIVGGGAMHLDDSLGAQEGLNLTFNHHEQACAIAAEGYTRLHNEMAAVCVTTGPGGTNALTGVVGAYLDSIPMLVISGQVRYDTTARSTGLPLRAVGDQEFDITKAASSMTKYAEMVIDPLQIRKCLEKAVHLALSGRPGPCWLDIPLNVQAAIIDTDELEPYDPRLDEKLLPPKTSKETAYSVLQRIKNAKRPVFYAGNGIRISGGIDAFTRLAKKLGIPVVTCWDSIDEIENDNPLFVGRAGNMGDRAGNFAIENSDLILAVGNRLSIRQVSYAWKEWAKNAFVIAVDADKYELQKPTVHVEMKIHADAKDFFQTLEQVLGSHPEFEMTKDKTRTLYNSQKVEFEGEVSDLPKDDTLHAFGKELTRPDDWNSLCLYWKKKYPVILPKYFEKESSKQTNVYAFMGKLCDALGEGQVTVVGNGSACVVGSHGFFIKKDQRFIINSAIASMGYDLPAAIGAAKALQNDARKMSLKASNSLTIDNADTINTSVILISGDGSIQMNLQELQTIITNKLPVKIFVINNAGYHSIRQTQTNLFNKHFVGIGPESRDLSFPDMERLARAYGYPYFACHTNDDLQKAIGDTLGSQDMPRETFDEYTDNSAGYAICEIFCDSEQFFEPKSATKKLPDGTLVSPPLYDLKPFLSREELMSNIVQIDK